MIVDPFLGHTSVKHRVRETLMGLHNVLTERLGHTPSFDEFYPVRLRGIVEFVLKWKLEEKALSREMSFGQRVTGRCIFESRLIQLDRDSTTESEMNFTLAHEIGHAVLHRAAPSCHGGVSLRQRSSRRVKLMSIDPETRKIEREADVFSVELLMPEKAIRRQFQGVIDHAGPSYTHGSMFSGSNLALRICGENDFAGRPRMPQKLQPELVAKRLANYKPVVEIRSLTEMFGVSTSAMASRLLELGIVY